MSKKLIVKRRFPFLTLIAALLTFPLPAAADTLVVPSPPVTALSKGSDGFTFAYQSPPGSVLASSFGGGTTVQSSFSGTIGAVDYVSYSDDSGLSYFIYTRCDLNGSCDVIRALSATSTDRIGGRLSRRCSEFASSATQGATVFARSGYRCRTGLYIEKTRVSKYVPVATAVEDGKIAFVTMHAHSSGIIESEVRLMRFGRRPCLVDARVLDAVEQGSVIRDVALVNGRVYWSFTSSSTASMGLARSKGCRRKSVPEVSQRTLPIGALGSITVGLDGKIYYGGQDGIHVADQPAPF